MKARTGLLLFALALLIRLPGLDLGLWFDEIWLLVDRLRLEASTLFVEYGSDNNHPLYTWLAWGCCRLFGESAWAIRLPALLAGAWAVPLLHRFAARWLAPREALAAALLLACSSHAVLFSQNARGYTLLLALPLVATDRLFDLLDRPDRRTVTTYALSLGAATFVHATAVFLALAHLPLVLKPRARNTAGGPSRLPLLALGLAGLFSLACHAGFLSDMLQFYRRPPEMRAAPFDWRSPLWTLRATIESFGIGLLPGAILAAGAATILVAGLIELGGRDRRLPWLAFGPAILGLLVMNLMGRNLWPRFFFAFSGFLLITAIAGLRALARGLSARIGRPNLEKRLVAMGLIVLFAAASFRLPAVWTLPKQDFVGAANGARAEALPGEPILTVGLATFPYTAWMKTGFEGVETVEALDRALDSSPTRSALVIDTLPIFLAARSPELARRVHQEGRLIRAFPGSIGGAEVSLRRLESR